MPQGEVLEFSRATKTFGAIPAVSDFSARIEPGIVTGFLGPNGAGKTTTLRMLLGLVRPSSGTATIGGLAYGDLDEPLRSVGAVLEATSFHPGRSAANHLKVYARAASIPLARVDETLGLVGLADAAGRRVGGYSLGMRQRLGLAFALLGDPGVLVLDEPSNGLDPEGIIWMRELLRTLAREGRTVLMSSHLLAEVQQVADRLVMISRGRLVFDGGVEELVDPSEYAVVVDAADRPALEAALVAEGLEYEVLRAGLTVRGTDPARVGALAHANGIALISLGRRGPALEEVFLDLVSGARVHASAGGPSVGGTDASGTDASAPDASAPIVAEGLEGASAEDDPAAEVSAEPIIEESPDIETSMPEASVIEDEVAEDAVVDDVVTDDEERAEEEREAEEAAAVAASLDSSAATPGAPGSGFSVATTGIIEILPPEAETETETESEPKPAPRAPRAWWEPTEPRLPLSTDGDGGTDETEETGHIEGVEEADAPERPEGEASVDAVDDVDPAGKDDRA